MCNETQSCVEPQDEGGYTVSVPALPGCVSEGETREEVLTNIKEAIELYLEPIKYDLKGKGEIVEVFI